MLNDANNALTTRPDLVTKLCQKYGIPNCADIIRGIPAGDGKVALIGLLASRSQDIKNIVNANPQLITVLQKTLTSSPEINKLVFGFDDVTFLKWMDEIKTNNLIQESITNPYLVKAWKYADDAFPNTPKCSN